jgi:hypothetical protein
LIYAGIADNKYPLFRGVHHDEWVKNIQLDRGKGQRREKSKYLKKGSGRSIKDTFTMDMLRAF